MQVASFSRGLKKAHLYKRNVSGGVTLLSGRELRPVSFTKRQQDEETFFQKPSWRAHVFPMFSSFPYWKHFAALSCLVYTPRGESPGGRAPGGERGLLSRKEAGNRAYIDSSVSFCSQYANYAYARWQGILTKIRAWKY